MYSGKPQLKKHFSRVKEKLWLWSDLQSHVLINAYMALFSACTLTNDIIKQNIDRRNSLFSYDVIQFLEFNTRQT